MTGQPAVPRLMLVTEAPRSRRPLLELAVEAVAGGVDAIYLRDIQLRPDDLARLVRKLRAAIGDDVLLLVNGGVEMARAAGTGLHLRERDPYPANVRELLATAVGTSPGLEMGAAQRSARRTLVGRSVHSPEEAALSGGVDYLMAGHVFKSFSKRGQRPLGLAAFAAIAAASPCPTIAIGGITPERVGTVIQAGAYGVAAIGAIVETDDPRAAVAALRAALDEAIDEQEQEQRESSAMSDTTTVLNNATTIEIIVNGKLVALPSGATVHDFLASKKMTDAMAIVERNGEIVPRGEYGETVLTAGDSLEVVHAVGGG